MPRFWEFEWPTRVQFGRGGLRRLGETARLLGAKALLVGYRDRAGLEEVYVQAEASLQKAGVAFSYLGVDPEPAADSILQAAEQAKAAEAELVVAVGGGSVIDAAKGVAAMALASGDLWDYTTAVGEPRPIVEALPVVAVPTTAGTGSEVSPVAVFTFHGIGEHPETPLKGSISSPILVPRVALVDPDLTLGSPPELTARCGADALGHAIEARISRRADPISSMLACRAVGLIYRNLRRAVEEPGDPQPRESLALAATLAGAAFSAAGVVVNHAMAHALGSVLGIPHGEAVAAGTPVQLRFNASRCRAEYTEMAEACGIPWDAEEVLATRFVEEIAGLLRSVGLPERLAVPNGVSQDLIDRLVGNAIESTAVVLPLNPRKVDREALAELFREVLQ